MSLVEVISIYLCSWRFSYGITLLTEAVCHHGFMTNMTVAPVFLVWFDLHATNMIILITRLVQRAKGWAEGEARPTFRTPTEPAPQPAASGKYAYCRESIIGTDLPVSVVCKSYFQSPPDRHSIDFGPRDTVHLIILSIRERLHRSRSLSKPAAHTVSM